MSKLTCRTCLSKGIKTKSLFALGSIYGKQITLRSILVTCAELQISQEDGLPQQICIHCIRQIEKAYSFRLMCEKNQITLTEKLKGSSDPFTEATVSKQGEYVDMTDTYNYDDKDSDQEYASSDSNINKKLTINDSRTEKSMDDTLAMQEKLIVSLIYGEKSQQIDTDSACKTKEPNREINKLTETAAIEEKINCNPSYNTPLDHGKYHCTLCKSVFELKSSLDLHHKRVHPSPDPNMVVNVKANKKFHPPNLICQICDKKCQTPDLLIRHLNFHKTGKEFHCDICGRDFAQPRTYESHIYSHTGERPFLCTECGKRFKQNADLRIHMRSHLNLYPYPCPSCDKKFRYSNRLIIHKRRHTGERPYQCPSCDKKFISSDRLQIHKRTHSGEKPFPCKICGKAFARSDALKVHSQTHTGEKPHICMKCNRGFSQAHCLRSHMKTHQRNDEVAQSEMSGAIQSTIQLGNEFNN